MSGVTIDHPTRGWNQMPQQRGSYAWWDGRRFTTIAHLAEDHWEYRGEDSAERSEVQTVVEPDSPGSRRVAVVGLFISLVAALAVLLLLVISRLPSSERESPLTLRVKDVHAHLETAGFKCSGLDVTESDIPSHVPSLIYADGRCGLELPRSIEIRAYGTQEEIKATVAALRSDYGGSYIIGNGWFMEMHPADLPLAHKIASALNARVAGNLHSIVVLAPLQLGPSATMPTPQSSTTTLQVQRDDSLVTRPGRDRSQGSVRDGR